MSKESRLGHMEPSIVGEFSPLWVGHHPQIGVNCVWDGATCASHPMLSRPPRASGKQPQSLSAATITANVGTGWEWAVIHASPRGGEGHRRCDHWGIDAEEDPWMVFIFSPVQWRQMQVHLSPSIQEPLCSLAFQYWI